jgi:hypothetical protein
MSACNGTCFDCPYDFCVPDTRAARPSKAEQRKGWRQDALFEIEDLEDLYPGLPEVRL